MPQDEACVGGGDPDTDLTRRFRTIGGSCKKQVSRDKSVQIIMIPKNEDRRFASAFFRSASASLRWTGAGQLRKPVLRIAMLTSASHDRACFRAGDSPTLTLALDVRGESTSSRSRSSQAYADRIGGISPDDDGGGGRGCAVYGEYRTGS